MAKITDVTVTIRLRFWVLPYIYTLAWLCDLMGTEPDMEKLHKIIAKGVYIK